MVRVENISECTLLFNCTAIICVELFAGIQPGNFDLVLINDDLDHAYKQLKEFVETNMMEKDSILEKKIDEQIIG